MTDVKLLPSFPQYTYNLRMTPQNNSKAETARIEPASLDDAQSITDIFISARRGMEYLPQELHTSGEIRDWLKSILSDKASTVLKAVLPDNRVVGFCVFAHYEFEHLYVIPNLQKQGIGEKLLRAAQNAQPQLELWVFQKNVDAIRFYERHGFRCAERTDGLRNEEKEPDARYVWDKKPSVG